MHRKKLAIVGAGPCGMTLGLLLNKLGFRDFSVFETRSESQLLNSHPAAHYLNSRSMEIFEGIDDLGRSIRMNSEDLRRFRHYRYCRTVGGFEFQATDQLSPDILAGLKRLSPVDPCHLPQHKLSRVMLDQYKRDGELAGLLSFGKTIKKINMQADGVELEVNDQANGASTTESFEWVVLSDGFRSRLRDSLDIKMKGDGEILHFLNVHFVSKKLSQAIQERGKTAMLHFVYNSDVAGCVVNHSYEDGIFVLQMPLSIRNVNVDRMLDVKDKSLVMACFDRTLGLQEGDIDIKGKAIWKLSSQIASVFYDRRAVLVGDSAHSFPPAGGLGMNSGIMDAHNLAFRIVNGLNEGSLKEYSAERYESVSSNMAVANTLFDRSLEIARTLGLDINNLKLLENIMQPLKALPFSESIFQLGKKAGSLHLESDRMASSLASKLSKKNLHIPLILVDNEFQQVLHIPDPLKPRSAKPELKSSTLYLLPTTGLQVFCKSFADLKTVSVDLRRELSDPHVDESFLNGNQSQQPTDKSQKGWEGEKKTPMDSGIVVIDAKDLSSELQGTGIPIGRYVSLSAVLNLVPNIPRDVTADRLVIRKDGYIQVFN